MMRSQLSLVTSMTGWMVQALIAGQEVGLSVGDGLRGAERWFDRATSGSGRTGYETQGGGSAFLRESKGKFDTLPVMTAVSILGRLECGSKKNNASLRKSARLLQKHPPVVRRRKLNFYYWFYGSSALFRLGSSQFRKWNKSLKAALLPSQRTAGCGEGSWDPLGEWCPAGGRVYAVALNALTLEVYYRRSR